MGLKRHAETSPRGRQIWNELDGFTEMSQRFSAFENDARKETLSSYVQLIIMHLMCASVCWSRGSRLLFGSSTASIFWGYLLCAFADCCNQCELHSSSGMNKT